MKMNKVALSHFCCRTTLQWQMSRKSVMHNLQFECAVDANVCTWFYELYENSWPMIFWVSVCRILHWWDYCFVQKLLEFNDTMQKLFLLIEVSRICTQLSHEQFRDASSTHPRTVHVWQRLSSVCIRVICETKYYS